ncbi:hypothetical protein NQZ68_022546 [Dissostichus eleginoides]|nr:hypothetical protein NQZ68_022546 [Dissostichus eleginoides]
MERRHTSPLMGGACIHQRRDAARQDGVTWPASAHPHDGTQRDGIQPDRCNSIIRASRAQPPSTASPLHSYPKENVRTNNQRYK